MKSNAVTRIIIWSIVLVLLLGILCGGLFLRRSGIVDFHRSETPLETIIPARIDDTGFDNQTYTATQPAIHTAEPGEKYTVSPDKIREISIQWVAGDILIQPGNVEAITFSEDDVSDPKYTLVYQARGDELEISFCEETIGNYFGVSTRSDIVKDLTIIVPTDWVCDSLEIDAASATVEINDMTIREMDFDGASGTCELENCTVGEMDIDTASGDITIIGSLDSLDCDAASASVYAVLSNTPSRLDMDSMSGDLDITLPEDAGFSLSMDGISTDFTSDFDTTLKNGNHVCGNGSCRINVKSMSSNVTIRKGDPSAAHHTHTNTCTTDPSSCPDNATHHTHTQACTDDPATCPDNNTLHHTETHNTH